MGRHEDETPLDARVPPHDMQAEAAVLSAMLLQSNGQIIDRVSPILDAFDFYSDANRRIYEGMLALRAVGKPIDILMLRGWLEDRDFLQRVGGAKYLAEILDCVPAVSNVEEYAERVKDKRRLRDVISLAREISAVGYTATDGKALIEQAESRFVDMGNENARGDLVPFNDCLKEAWDRMQALRKGEISGTPCGIPSLDWMTAGWQDSDLIVVGGRPGMGKTAFAFRACIEAARHRKGDVQYASAFFSLEMPRWQIAMRASCTEAFVDQSRARKNTLSNHEGAAITKAQNYLCQLPIYVDETTPMTVMELRAKIRRLQSRLAPHNVKLGLVAVDYLQLLHPSAIMGRMSRRESVDMVARELKQTAVQCGVPLMALAQLNRASDASGEGRRPNLSDLREAGEIEQAADAVIFIYRPGYYVKPSGDPDEKDRMEQDQVDVVDPDGHTRPAGENAEIIVSKQRNGPTGIAKCWYRPKFVRFDAKADDDPERESKGE